MDDATGFTLVYVYGSEHARIAAEGLTIDECRRIAKGVAKLPDLLSQAKKKNPQALACFPPVLLFQ